ncbi:MAG TPA: biotin carboxylase N-terminal domain-containing protein [Thermoanaerobaculia bacterium]|jgi:acetyl-CoA carboxylase biotin carboxylase subunit|nr:biotin carboxylase N-terminal domain-containing protein [Thermoanaerobaculia bacterium]
MRLLVANRGEIAVRIFRACRDLGIETVAVYSDADRTALHVTMADYAARLGPAPSPESYLSIPRILEAAKKTGASLVHPGYGFLAESADFARACADAGLTFVGPSPSAIEAMGAKTTSRMLMQSAGVPIVPGTTTPARDTSELAEFARRAGYPIFLKASAGGGGKGMRRVASEAELAPAFARASAEAQASFGDGSIYAEKLLERPRHVEVQIAADQRGHRVAVGERECSIQRRHQKVVEECPSPAVGPELRTQLLSAALAAAEAVGYDSCGTVEFLLAPDGSFYFLEMNTRLQVEHPITEEVWGVDLAVEMIRAALGESLSFRAEDLAPRGHAIECRVYAEDASRGFAPSPGVVAGLRLPGGPGVRNDVGIEAGSGVPIDYDPMLGKLIVAGSDRAAAIRRLARALEEYEIAGVETTLPLFRALVADAEFRAATFHTQWLDAWLTERKLELSEATVDEAILAAGSVSIDGGAPPTGRSAPASRWRGTARAEALRPHLDRSRRTRP